MRYIMCTYFVVKRPGLGLGTRPGPGIGAWDWGQGMGNGEWKNGKLEIEGTPVPGDDSIISQATTTHPPAPPNF